MEVTVSVVVVVGGIAFAKPVRGVVGAWGVEAMSGRSLGECVGGGGFAVFVEVVVVERVDVTMEELWDGEVVRVGPLVAVKVDVVGEVREVRVVDGCLW